MSLPGYTFVTTAGDTFVTAGGDTFVTDTYVVGSAKSSGSVSESSGGGTFTDSTSDGSTLSTDSVGSGSDSGSGDSASTSAFLTYWGNAVTYRDTLALVDERLYGAVDFKKQEVWYGGFRETA